MPGEVKDEEDEMMIEGDIIPAKGREEVIHGKNLSLKFKLPTIQV